MPDALPFSIMPGRIDRWGKCTFVALLNEQQITSESYHPGDGDARRKSARLWANDSRLWNGAVPTVEAVVHALESAERQALDTPVGYTDDVDDEWVECEKDASTPTADTSDNKPPKKSQATTLVELVTLADGVTLWHTPDGDGYATIQAGEHSENWPIRSRRFRQWACKLYLEVHDKVPGGQGVQDAVTTLEGIAVHRGAEHRIYVRLAEHYGVLYLDLCNAEWEAVEVKTGWWEVVQNPPIKFRRARGMLPLPVPTTRGDINDLRQFVNVHDSGVFTLIVAWLIGTFHPRGPYAILEVDGEHGSAKTTLCRMLRRLVDPNEADLRTQPRDERDLVIAARNGHVLGFDNFSGIQGWLSDGLSRIATGTGFGTRELYTNDEEVIFSGARPIICNGIGGVATRSDLLDRTIRVDLPAIPEDKRKPEADLWHDFDAARPGLLGAILDAVATALNRAPAVKLDRLPRMADFARWIVAAEPCLPWEPGAFMAAYWGNREAANESALEASPVAGVLRTWFDRQQGTTWTGTATDLLPELAKVATDAIKAQRHWPKSGRGLSGTLRRLAPNLRAVGIDVLFDTEGRGNEKRRIIVVRRFGNDIDPIDPTIPDPPGDPGNPDSRGRPRNDGDATAPPQPSPDTPLFGPGDAHGNDGNGGDGRLHNYSNVDDDESDRRERTAIMAVEAEAEGGT